jgi:hypothetical protein
MGPLDSRATSEIVADVYPVCYACRHATAGHHRGYCVRRCGCQLFPIHIMRDWLAAEEVANKVRVLLTTGHAL